MGNADIIQAFGRNVKERRMQLGITQAQLADMLGYSAKAVSKWESGNGLPSAVLLPIIARTLNTDIDTLMRISMTPLYYLGIDGGGTKTEFCLVDREGKTVASKILGGSNPNDIGLSACFAVIKEGITAVCEQIPIERISVFAGIAGAGAGDNGKKLEKFLSTFGFATAACGSDAQNAIAAALGNRDGIMVIMGTGNVTFVQSQGKVSRIGGFNYLFDEGGSGFTIGRDAILYALKSEERGDTSSLLYSLIRKKCAAETVQARLADYYVGGKRMIAEVAPLVFEAYRGGEPVARQILDRNAAVVAEQIACGAEKLPGGCPETVLVGGLTQQADILIPLIEKHLQIQCNITAFRGTVVTGALRLAGMEENND